MFLTLDIILLKSKQASAIRFRTGWHNCNNPPILELNRVYGSPTHEHVFACKEPLELARRSLATSIRTRTESAILALCLPLARKTARDRVFKRSGTENSAV